jgi:hypothetical protein
MLARDLTGFDATLLERLYRNGLPDFSESDALSSNDRIVEHAYTLAAMDDRSYLTREDMLQAITALKFTPDNTMKQLLEATEERGQSNIKIIKKGTAAPMAVTNGAGTSGGVLPNAQPKVVSTNTNTGAGGNGTLNPTLKNHMLQLMHAGDITEIERQAFLRGNPTGIFLGHNTLKGSDKYYLIVERPDGTSAAFYGGVNKPYASKVYGPGEKSYAKITHEKKGKGYQTIWEY